MRLQKPGDDNAQIALHVFELLSRLQDVSLWDVAGFGARSNKSSGLSQVVHYILLRSKHFSCGDQFGAIRFEWGSQEFAFDENYHALVDFSGYDFPII